MIFSFKLSNIFKGSFYFDKKMEQTNQNKEMQCINKRKGIYICKKQQCQQQGILCKQQQCNCNKIHQKCQKAQISQIMQKISPNDSFFYPLKNSIQTKIDKIIEELLKFKQKAQKIFIERLSAKQISQAHTDLSKIFNEANKNDFKGIKIAKKIHDMEYVNKDRQKQLIQSTRNIQQILNKAQNQLKQYTKKTQHELNLLAISCQFYHTSFQFVNSKIIKSIQQTKTMLGFFYKIPKSATLLYRASQNDFEVKQFHVKCANIPHTLTICETEFNKILGGYTPMSWGGLEYKGYIADESEETFIYSLSRKQKFELRSKNFALLCQSQGGPNFGTGNFYICNNSSIKEHSSFWINTHYFYNKNYTKNERQTFYDITGNPNSDDKFKVKEWQVWQLKF